MADLLLLVPLLLASVLAQDIAPAPPSIGADVPLIYFGPPPSSVDPRLVGPVQLLKSGTVDLQNGRITLPLYRGHLMDDPNYNIWYVLTDTTDFQNAAALGLNPSAKLNYANVGRGARNATLGTDGRLYFGSGTVDFSPKRQVTPGQEPNYFPPAAAQPGSIGSSDYSPLVHILNGGGHIYNAPIIAGDVNPEDLQQYCNGSRDENAEAILHDKVISICPSEDGYGGNVTLSLTPGFSFAKPVLYLSFEASTDVVATLESATLAPALSDIPIGRDDSAFSAVERLFAVINGFTNGDVPEGSNETHPLRQGMNSAVRGDGSPLNVLGGIPTVATDYSPLWDVHLGEWTQYAVDAGYRTRWLEEFQVLGFAEKGYVTGPGGSPFGSVGVIVNCPIVFRFL